MLLYTDYRGSVAKSPSKRDEWFENAHLDVLHPEGDQLEFVKRLFGISELEEMKRASLMKKYLPFAEFLFALRNFESGTFSTLKPPVSRRSVIFRRR